MSAGDGDGAELTPEPVNYSRGTDKHDAYPEQRTAVSFDAFADAVLSDRSKAKGLTWFSAPFAGNDGRHHRCRDGALPRRFLGLDQDGGTAHGFVEIGMWLAQYRGFGYTTARHTTTNPRARYILALSRPIDRAEGIRLGSALQRFIEAHVGTRAVVWDKSAHQGEQPLYTPLMGAQPMRYDGDPIDVDAVLATAPKEEPRVRRADEPDPYRAALLDRGLVLRELGPGKDAIACPFAQDHSESTSDSSTAYFWPRHGGYKWGGIHCLHAHCAERNKDQRLYIEKLGLDPREVWRGQAGAAPCDALPPLESYAGDAAQEDARQHTAGNGATAGDEAKGAAPDMDSPGTRLLPSPSNPLAVARKLIEEKYQTDAGLTLINHRGDFFRWDGACWPERDRLDIRRDAYAFVEGAISLDAEGRSQPFAPTVRKINDLIDALRACVGITSEHEPPVWLDGRANPPASEIVAMRNGLLHLPTRKVLPHTPGFFAHHALAFPFVSDAPEPARWLDFLHQLWPGDHASITALQEMFGYVIGGDTRQQKIFLLVGPRRAGKGTIGRVLTGILGRHNVAAPTLASLSTNFGLAPLIGKPLALISDARLSAKADAKAAVERLLSISGEDSLTIDRKYREPWTGRLPSRIVVLTNELPGLTDASGALSSRFIVLVLSASFLGRENPGLTDELLAEAPSILRWGLEGLNRLNRRGHFVMPESGRDAVQQLEDLASPVAAFIRERCTVGKGDVEVDVLWGAWKEWCEGQGRGHGTKAVFGRDLRAALPSVKKSRPRDGEERQYRYEGITLGAVGNTLAGRGDRPDHSGRGAAAEPAGPSGRRDHAMYPLHGGTPAGRTCPRCDGEGCDWCGGMGRLVDDEPKETRP